MLPVSLPPPLLLRALSLGLLWLEQGSHVARAAGDVRYFRPRQGHYLLWLIPRLRLSTSTASEAVRAARPDCIQRPRVFFSGQERGRKNKEEMRYINAAEVFCSWKDEAGYRGRARQVSAHMGLGLVLRLKYARPLGLCL